jgi:hypothetical protein
MYQFYDHNDLCTFSPEYVYLDTFLRSCADVERKRSSQRPWSYAICLFYSRLPLYDTEDAFCVANSAACGPNARVEI